MGDFAASFRIYYNDAFGGDTINLLRDYFEDSSSFFHVLGRDFTAFSHFHGFIGDIYYYNWGEVSFPECYVTNVPECISCEICPSTYEYYDCSLNFSSRTCDRIEKKNECPDCCEDGLIWIDGECVGCGLLCYSCSTHETAANSLDAGNCDVCKEFGEFTDPPGRDCFCPEPYFHDVENNRCCEPHCNSCPEAPFECVECFYGYLLRDKVGFDEIGLPLLGNECVQNNCAGGIPSGDNLCQGPPGYSIIGEECDDNNECTCNSLDCRCIKIPCVEGCALCNSFTDMSRCLECEDGYLDIAPITLDPDDQYAYCVTECPSGFTLDPCSPDPSKELILKY